MNIFKIFLAFRKSRSFLPAKCNGCQVIFEKTSKLTEHLRQSQTCLQIMGGDIAKASKITVKMKRKNHYHENIDQERTGNRESYKRNAGARKRARFNKSGRFGPSFPCLVCHSLNWLGNVDSVELTDIDQKYLCLPYIEKHKLLFFKKGSYYCCKRCKEKIKTGAMPANAARNTLLCPWESVSQAHLMLSEVFFKESNFNWIAEAQMLLILTSIASQLTGPFCSGPVH